MRESSEHKITYRRITYGFLMVLGLWLLTAVLMPAQTVQAPSPPIDTQSIQATSDSLRETVQLVNVDRWKASKEVKSVAQDDIASILSDLGSTLPGLLRNAETTPGSFKSAFDVYRNVNALYDVLLRVSQAATFIGAGDDSTRLQTALNSLAKVRNSLSASLVTASDQRDIELAQLRTKVQLQPGGAAGQSSSPKKVVVDDGPQKTSKSKTKPAKTQTNPQ